MIKRRIFATFLRICNATLFALVCVFAINPVFSETVNVDAGEKMSCNQDTLGTTESVNFAGNWELNTYRMSYFKDGSQLQNISAEYQTYTIEDDSPKALPGADSVSKMGYSFGGWCVYDSENLPENEELAECEEPVEEFEIDSENLGDRNLYANFNAITYTISYELNGGTNYAGAPREYTTESDTIILQDASKTGYDFDGWYDNAGFNGTAITQIANGSTGDKTLYAKFTPITYTITYNLDGGTNSANNPSTYTIETPTITFETPTKANNIFVGWYDENDDVVTSIPSGSTGDVVLNAHWADNKFTITTVQANANNGTNEFKFQMSAKGDFYVDWGDGTFDHIDRASNTTQTIYTHTYANNGTYTIKFGGAATGYSSNDNVSAIQFGGFSGDSSTTITAVSGSLGAIFPTLNDGSNDLTKQPRFEHVFHGTSALYSVPPTLFNGVFGSATGMFAYSFKGSGLSGTLPSGLFSGVDGGADIMFAHAFNGCGNLTGLPVGLFDGITTSGNSMFTYAFAYTGLTELPRGLFQNIQTVDDYMFYGTFLECSDLTTIPDDLFASLSGTPALYGFTLMFGNDVALNMFKYANNSTSNYIPPYFFADLSSAGYTTGPMQGIFINTGLATACNAGMYEYDTGFTVDLNPKVSCAPCPSSHPNSVYADNESINKCYKPMACPALVCPNDSTSCSYNGVSSWNEYYGASPTTHCTIHVTCPENGFVVVDNDTDHPGCEIIEYNISYELNGGLIYENAPEKYTVKTPTIILGAPTKTGHTFVGWFDNAGFNGAAITQIPFGSFGDKTFYAKWTANTYDIKYLCNDNQNPPALTTTRTYGNASGYTVPMVSTLCHVIGWTPQGWDCVRDDNDANINNTISENAYLESWTIASGVTCTAQWSQNHYEVIFKENTANGASVLSVPEKIVYVADDLPFVVQNQDDSAVGYAEHPEKTGYSFVNWCFNSNNTDCYLEPQISMVGGAEPAVQTVLWAKWAVDKYTISYDLDGGTNYTGAPREYTIESDTIIFGTPTKTGYTFVGWFDDSDNQITQIPAGSTGDVSVKAVWDIDTYTISYELNGGTNYAGAPREYTVESDTIIFGTPTKTGYTFVGWFDDSDTQITQIPTGSTGDVSITAMWEANEYLVKYRCAENTVYNSAENIIVFDEAYNFINNFGYTSGGQDLCAKVGFTFDGWNCSADSDNSFVAPNNTEHWNINSNVTCIASWEEHTFNVTFDANSSDVTNPNAMDGVLVSSCAYSTGCEIPENRYVNNGYYLNGWATESNGSGSFYQPESVIKEQEDDVILYAQWLPIETFCNAGTYLAKGTYGSCTICEVGHYCPGTPEGTYWLYDTTKDQGKESCVELMLNDEATTVSTGSVSENDCIMRCNSYINGKTGYNLLNRDGLPGFYRYGETASSVCKYAAQIQYVDNEDVLTYECPNVDYVLPTNATIELCKPQQLEAPGMTFAGWRDNTGRWYNINALENVDAYNFVPRNGIVTMTAEWDKDKYDVVYNCNNDSGDKIVVEGVEFESDQTLLDSSKCSYKGHTFEYWSCDIDYEDDSFKMPDRNVTCEAQWITNYYNIVFDGNGADSGETEPMLDLNFDESYDLNANGFEKTGYVFAGWCDSIDSETKECIGEKYEDKASVTQLATGGTVTLYAIWELIRYNITYVMPVGFTATNPGYYYVTTETFTLSPNVNKVGYSFQGWCTDSELQNCSATQKVLQGTTGNLKFYLNVIPIEYTIDYKNVDGTDVTVPDESPRTYTINDVVVFPGTAYNSGYEFVGWYENKNLTVSTRGLPAGSAGNKVVYAKWNAQESTIKYDCVVNDKTFEKTGLVGTGTTVASAEDCSLPYRKIDYWTCGTEIFEPGATIKFAPEDIVCQATWLEEEIYNIYYKTPSGDDIEVPADSPRTYTSSDIVRLPDRRDIHKTGYSFNGWYKNANLTSSSIGWPAGESGDKTVYGQWIPNTYTITYNCAVNNKQFTQNGKYGLSVTVMGAENCANNAELEYWTCADNEYQPGEELTVSASDIVCTATWIEPELEVYNINYRNTDDSDVVITDSSVPRTYTVEDIVKYPDNTQVSNLGYELVGWYENKNLTGSTIGLPRGSMGNKVVYAKWKKKNHTFEYNCWDGKHVKIPVTYGTQITAQTIYDNCTPNIGRSPINWDCDDDNGLYPIEMTTPDYNLVCDIVWEDEEYEIVYIDGENVLDLMPNTYTIDSDIDLPTPDPVYGSDFAGWCDGTETCSGTIAEINPGTTGNKVLYAQWTEKMITCVAGTYLPANTETCVPCDEINKYCPGGTYKYHTIGDLGKEICPAEYAKAEIGSDEKTDCYVQGICPELTECPDNNATSCSYIDDTTWIEHYGDIAITHCIIRIDTCHTGYEVVDNACSLHNYTIIYKDGADVLDLTPARYDIVSEVKLPTITKTGYDFIGWCDGAATCNNPINMIPVGTIGNKTLYAQWVIKLIVCEPGEYLPAESENCKICEYDSYCGGGDYFVDTIDQGIADCPLAYPQSALGNASINGCYKPCVDENAIQVSGNIYRDGTDTCMYKYAINYVLDGGLFSGYYPRSYVYGAGEIELIEPEKDKYRFMGWYMTDDFSDEAVTVFGANQPGPVTFYAKWQYRNICDSGIWLHFGNDDEVGKVCLSDEKPTSPAVAFDIDGTTYYLGMTEDTGLPMNIETNSKFHVDYDGKHYNAHDLSVM